LFPFLQGFVIHYLVAYVGMVVYMEFYGALN